MRLVQLVPVSLLAVTLVGCGTLSPRSVRGGECKVFTAPSFVPKGKVKSDQYWIDDQVESGVAACGWKRPKGRPADDIAAQQAPAKKALKAKGWNLLKRWKGE
jgi:hypothetical protein